MKSRVSAVNVLNRVYKRNSSETLTTPDMFMALGKDSAKPLDVNYVATQVSLLKGHGFVTPNYEDSKGYKRRVSITLTQEGMAVLKRNPSKQLASPQQASPLAQDSNNREITITSVRRDIERLRVKEPE